MGARDRDPAAQGLPPRPGKDPALRIAGHGAAGDLGLPAHPLRDQRPDLHRGHERGHRPGPGQVQKDRPHHPPPGRWPGFFPLTGSSASSTVSWPASPARRSSTRGASAATPASSSAPATTTTPAGNPTTTAPPPTPPPSPTPPPP